MPDLTGIILKNWKFISGFTLLAVVITLIAVLLSPKKYLSVATALPANSAMSDKARLFNSNIEALYSDFGSPDELDRMEGTATLDTIFIATVNEMKLLQHYGIHSKNENYKAVARLKKDSKVSRTGYGELRVEVWDRDRNMAALLANSIMQKIQDLHQHLQNESNNKVLHQLLGEHERKEQAYRVLSNSNKIKAGGNDEVLQVKKAALLDQLLQEEKMINQYQLAIQTNPQVLLIVERARPSATPGKPRMLSTILFALFGSFLFAILLSLLLESRKSSS